MDFSFDNNYIYIVGIVVVVVILYLANREPSFNPQATHIPPAMKGDFTF